MSEESTRGNIILAIPNINFADGFKKHLKKKNFKVFDIIVDIEHLMEELVKLDEKEIKVDGIILTSDVAKKLDDTRLELLSDCLIKIREKYSHINIVVLANEKKGHPFLSEVVQMGIYNVFLKGTEEITIDLLEEVLTTPRSFSFAAGYLNASPEYRWRKMSYSIHTTPDEEDDDDDGGSSGGNSKTGVQKQVIKKEVNKQVIKRNYNINVQNNVEKVVGIPIDKKLILVGSPFSRSGSTFFSHLLARELAKMGVSVTYIESPYAPSYSYDRFIGHERNPEYRSKFYQYTKQIDPKKPSVTDWAVEDVQLVTKHPSNEPIYDHKEVPFDVYMKILFASKSIVTIVDVGTDWSREVYQDIFDISAKAYFMIEPDISNIQMLEDPDNNKFGLYHELFRDEKTSLIGNRFDESILKNEMMKKLYKEKLKTTIPAFPSKDVFYTHYEGTFINDMKIHQKQINEMLFPVIEELFPKEFLKKYRKQNGLFSGLFNKKFSVEREEM